jgi:myo-inositol-1(or 4)-monophosphatase
VLALADLARRSPLRLGRRRPALGSPAYHLALVARGAADGAILEQARLWDVAAGLALLEASGGEAIDLATGRSVDLDAWLGGDPPRRLLAARRGARAELLQRVRRAS